MLKFFYEFNQYDNETIKGPVKFNLSLSVCLLVLRFGTLVFFVGLGGQKC